MTAMIAYRCRTLVPMNGVPIENGVFVVNEGVLIEVGHANQTLRSHVGTVIDLGEVAVLPGLINAHCHLDYTLMRGAILPANSFSHWVSRINALKRSFTDSDYIRSMELGFAELRRNGITTVLDIVANPQIFPFFPDTPIRTWFCLELIDVRPRPWIDKSAFGSWLFFSEEEKLNGGLGLSPHSPYTASTSMYELALKCARMHNMLVTTHVGESREEYEMFASNRGALHDFLAMLGRPMADCGATSPLRHLISNRLIGEDCILVHLNELDSRDLELLANSRWRSLHVVHCPKSHRFLHHRRFPMEALLERGLNVCLGTDSLASNDSLNLFSEMRAARKNYPKLAAQNLLEMVTVRPARALKMERDLGKIAVGYLADLIAIPFTGAGDEVYEAIIENRDPIEWMMINGKIAG
jgi:cytosine/adenosine deaminase-related metal-dependent hydrolase